MAPVSDVEVDVSGKGEGSLSLDNCLCPVCLEMFLEPVTLPCTHTFCKGCFLESVDKATLCCPMCRKRVSTWARLNSRKNTLVNETLWKRIQTAFPQQCQRRLNGQDGVTEGDLEVSLCFPRVSQPGEVRQEYHDQITKLTEEKRVLDEAERTASEEYIQRLLAEEEDQLQEERRRWAEDERLARMLSQQLNSSAVSQENLRPADVTPVKKNEKVSAGQIEKFLLRLPSKRSPSHCSSDSSLMPNKENILLSRMELQTEHLLPEVDYCGTQSHRQNDSDGQTVQSEPLSLPALPLSSYMEDQQQLVDDVEPSSVKRKSSELETSEDEVMTFKRGGSSLPSSSSSSSSSSSEPGASAVQGRVEWEAELLSRQQQEEKDRLIAQLLQKELNKEERQLATDRRRGSTDAYQLRRQCKGKIGSVQTPSRPSKATRTSTPSSSPAASSVKSLKKTNSSTNAPSGRGSKQARLTDMFTSLSS